MANAVWVVLVDGAIDAVWDTEAQAKKEARDLVKMDCGKVTVRRFDNESAAYAWADKH